ncbi:MAG: hypothetical protein JO210_16880 [Acidobacteriaceae bacterium]|nr:hypothetical protein [Acidobacteriaceae bacterium]
MPFLLKETISLDWKFPAEREELLAQLAYLNSLSTGQRSQEMAAFSQLQLSPQLATFDWVNLPGQFLERLSAHLWATSQMDTFRAASERYMKAFRSAQPDLPPAIPRLAVVLIGQGIADSSYPLFRKLRREGVYFKKVSSSGGLESVRDLLESRATLHPAPYAHWFIDGGDTSMDGHNVALVSYVNLSAVRKRLTAKMTEAFESHMPSEALRTMLAEITPEDLGLKNSGDDEVLNRFRVSLFTEGSGTQIYSTTFVQWTAREALRRAKPLTMVARFTPRQRQAPMNELLSGTSQATTDPAGSLVDADMGAWYTWIGLQRLTGADRSCFVAWFEDHNEAVAVGPLFPPGKEETAPVRLLDLLNRAAGVNRTAATKQS